MFLSGAQNDVERRGNDFVRNNNTKADGSVVVVQRVRSDLVIRVGSERLYERKKEKKSTASRA